MYNETQKGKKCKISNSCSIIVDPVRIQTLYWIRHSEENGTKCLSTQCEVKKIVSSFWWDIFNTPYLIPKDSVVIFC